MWTLCRRPPQTGPAGSSVVTALARLSGALRYSAQPDRASHSGYRGGSRMGIDALGIDPALGERSEDRLQHLQRTGRNGRSKARLSGTVGAPPLHRPRDGFLRMASAGNRQKATLVFRRAPVGRHWPWRASGTTGRMASRSLRVAPSWSGRPTRPSPASTTAARSCWGMLRYHCGSARFCNGKTFHVRWPCRMVACGVSPVEIDSQL